jgi:5-methylthioadenosine/S-adenosylhomocysteine deaminase
MAQQSRRRTTDPFTEAYLAGMPASLVGKPSATRRPPKPKALAMPGEAIALGGHLITPEGARKGWVTIAGGRITAISEHKPTDAHPLQTDGVILPGMLDLHGHPEFNVFAPWEPPDTYVNRQAWRSSPRYADLIKNPQKRLIKALPLGTQLRYAEIRAVVGGVTAIQGASFGVQGTTESMVRNVDGVVFGEHRARAAVDLEAGESLNKVLAEIAAHTVTAFYIHLAEGKRDDAESQQEFDELETLHALTKATVIIHGTAMNRDQFGKAKDAGARLVWSPQSNLRLYGETTRAADALDVGLPIALGADWQPSGSTSLLAEMKVARRELANQRYPITAQQLVAMVTSGAAEVAGLSDHLGRLEVGRVADLVVMDRLVDNAYESVCQSTPAEVELVMIGGDLVYGREEYIKRLPFDMAAARFEPVVAWGRRMLLDTSFEMNPGEKTTPRLSAIRQSLTSIYPQVGPIWA